MNLNLRPVQRIMHDHIVDVPRCALFASMGIGKTSSALAALDLLSLTDDGPTLVIAPLRVARDTWPAEVAKWDNFKHLRVSAIVGTVSQRTAAVAAKADIYSTNYENLPWLVEHLGDAWPFTKVIADESTKLKSFRLRQGGSRAQALGQVAHDKVTRFIALTGTPTPNGIKDLWGQMYFIDKGQRLGRSFHAFQQRWFRPDRSGFGMIPLPHAQAEIQSLIADVCLTVKAEDYFDLSEPVVNTIKVTLPAKARDVYKAMEKAMFAELSGGEEIEAFGAAARTLKCLQIANGAAYTGADEEWAPIHDQKIEALGELLEEQGGNPVLCAYHFKSDRQRILAAFPHAIDVATPAGFKRALKGEGSLWIGHPASMGHGIDGLQEHCHTAAFFGHWWNFDERQQFIERIGPVRQMQSGKNKVVTIHNIVAANTIDELVISRVGEKRSVQEILLEAMKRENTK